MDPDASTPVVTKCGLVTKLPPLPPPDAGYGAQIFCPFLLDAGSHLDHYCPVEDRCCEGPQGSPSVCTPRTDPCSAATSALDWGCQFAGDGQCASGELCCANGALILNSDPSTCGNYPKGFTKTGCFAGATCPDGQFALCTADADCPAGQTCHAFEAGDVKELGGCQ